MPRRGGSLTPPRRSGYVGVEVRPALLEALRTVAPPDRKQMIPLPIVLLADPLPRGGGSFGTGKSSLVSAVQPGLGPTWMVSGTVFEKWLGSL